MEIVLMCPGASSGQAAFSAEMVEGIPAPERRYNIVDGKIVLSGFSDTVLHHDADVLLANPLYRMPTPAEQEAFAQQAQQSGQIQESTGQESNLDAFTAQVQRVNGDGEAILTENAEPPESPPAVDDSAQSKKKASGG